jgi:hypothetical protein
MIGRVLFAVSALFVVSKIADASLLAEARR